MNNNIDLLKNMNTGLGEETFEVVGYLPPQGVIPPQQEMTQPPIEQQQAQQEQVPQEEEFTIVGKLEKPQESWGEYFARNALLIGKGVGKRALQIPNDILDISKSVSRSLRPSNEDANNFLISLESKGLIKDKKFFEERMSKINEKKEDASFGGPLSPLLEYTQENFLRPAGEKFAKGVETVGDVLGLGPIKPKGILEEFVYAGAKDVTSYAIPTLIGLAFGGPAAIGLGTSAILSQATIPNIGKYTAKFAGAPKKVQNGIKNALQVGMGLYNAYKAWTPKMAATAEYTALEAAHPQIRNQKISLIEANKASAPIVKKIGTATIGPTKKVFNETGIPELLNRLESPMGIADAIAEQKTINSILSKGLKDKPAAVLLRDLSKSIKKDILNFGKSATDIPTQDFVKTFKAAEDLTEQLNKTAISLNFIKKHNKSITRAGVGSLTLGLIDQVVAPLYEGGENDVPGKTKLLRGASGLFLALGSAALGIRGLNFLLKGPAIQKHYLGVIHAAARKNIVQVIHHVKKLDKEVKKVVPKS